MTEHAFDTPTPIRLYVEIGKGTVSLEATETDQTLVVVDGERAEDVLVTRDGDDVSVVAPQQRGFLAGSAEVHVHVTLPRDADLATRLGSADLRARGRFGTGLLRSGSGVVDVEELTGETAISTGSGDVRVGTVHGDLSVKSGSGDLRVGRAASQARVSTGSGDIEIGESGGPLIVKTGSGDLRVGRPGSDVAMTTGSGDTEIGFAAPGRVTVKGASGDLRVGVPTGLPVWTDVKSLSGRVHSTLPSPGEPAQGQPYLAVHAVTVSGDVLLDPAPEPA